MPNRQTRLTKMMASRLLSKLMTLALTAAIAFTGSATMSASASDSDQQYAQLESQLDTKGKHGKAEQADALYDLAKAHFENHDLAQAEALMRQSLDLEKTLKRSVCLVRTQTALATICASAGKTDDARQLYEEVLAFANEHKMTDEAISTAISLGALAMQQGQLSEAGKIYHQALSDAEAHGALAAESSALINLSVVARGRK